MKELIQGNAMRYESNGRAYIDLEQEHKPTYSVTTIIDRAWGQPKPLADWRMKDGHDRAIDFIIGEHQVVNWVISEEYLELDPKEKSDLPRKLNRDYVNERARIGTQVHSILMHLSQGDILPKDLAFTPDGNVDLTSDIYEEVPEEVKYRVKACMKFWKECKVVPLGVEVAMHSPNYLFSGTADLICEMDGERWLIDYKTGKDTHDEQHVQLNCYGLLALEFTHIDRLGILHLPSEGTWKKSSRKGWKNAKEYCLIEVEWNKRIVDALVEKFTFLNNNIRPKGKKND